MYPPTPVGDRRSQSLSFRGRLFLSQGRHGGRRRQILSYDESTAARGRARSRMRKDRERAGQEGTGQGRTGWKRKRRTRKRRTRMRRTGVERDRTAVRET